MTIAQDHPMLAAHGLNLQVDGRWVLRDVQFQLGRGWTALIGPNGAGKSTLLKALAGLMPGSASAVCLGTQALNHWPVNHRARAVAWLPQQDATSGDLTVRETVSLGRLPHTGLWGRWRAQDEQAVQDALQRTDCLAWQHRSVQRLSGGERQRVHLARALATGAPVLLLDEPTAHLDPPHQWALARLFRELSATHTVVTVLHDLTMALQADTLMALEAGRVVACAAHDDPALHRQIERLFAPAIRIQALPGAAGRYGAMPVPLDC